MSEKVQRYTKRGIVLLIALFGLTLWSLSKLVATIDELVESNQSLSTQLDGQTKISKKYAMELAQTQKDLQDVQTLMAEVQSENKRLNERIASLGDIDELKANMAKLQELNEQITKELAMFKGEDISMLGVNSAGDGKTLISKYKKQISRVKSRIGDLKQEIYLAKVKTQKEEDRLMMEAGNNGFLVRNGMMAPPTFALPAKNLKVDVTFVK